MANGTRNPSEIKEERTIKQEVLYSFDLVTSAWLFFIIGVSQRIIENKKCLMV